MTKATRGLHPLSYGLCRRDAHQASRGSGAVPGAALLSVRLATFLRRMLSSRVLSQVEGWQLRSSPTASVLSTVHFMDLVACRHRGMTELGDAGATEES